MRIDTLSPPPSYDSINAYRSDPRLKADLNPTAKAQQERIAYLKTTAQGPIIDDILKLSGTIRFVENDFAAIASEMTRLDDRNIVSAKFASKWKILHHDYTMLISDSQSMANDISDKINDLVTVYIPILQLPDETMESKKELLVDYIEELESFKTNAQENINLFLGLAQDVETFKNTLEKLVDSDIKAMENNIEDIDKKISELEKALRSFKTSGLLQRGWSVMKVLTGKAIEEAPPTETEQVDPTQEEISGIDALGKISTTIREEMMGIVVRYLHSDLANDLNKKSKETDVATTEKRLALFQFVREQSGMIHDHFTVILQNVVKLKPVFDGMTQNITTIQGVWIMLLKDSVTILNKLVSVTDAKCKVFNTDVFQELAKISSGSILTLPADEGSFYLCAVDYHQHFGTPDSNPEPEKQPTNDNGFPLDPKDSISVPARIQKSSISIETGQYTIENVRWKNLAYLPNPNHDTPVAAGVERENDNERWNVNKLSNGHYTIESVGNQMFAAAGHRAKKGAIVGGWAEPQQWNLQKTRVKGNFTIATTDTRLFWGLVDNQLDTPISLAKSATDNRNAWIFKKI